MKQSDQLKILGEITGINLRCFNESCEVTIEIDGKEIILIQSCGEVIDHHITRIGIIDCIENDHTDSGRKHAEPGASPQSKNG